MPRTLEVSTADALQRITTEIRAASAMASTVRGITEATRATLRAPGLEPTREQLEGMLHGLLAHLDQAIDAYDEAAR